ncbi:hypothetical protein WK99_32995 [Burkholderia ubonensis]|nr:hypothetical protein WK99_32995 [Burkholderia ubonensis]
MSLEFDPSTCNRIDIDLLRCATGRVGRVRLSRTLFRPPQLLDYHRVAARAVGPNERLLETGEILIEQQGKQIHGIPLGFKFQQFHSVRAFMF